MNPRQGSVEQTYRTYFGLIRAKCRRVLGDGHEAEDVAQETFIRLWKNRHEVATDPCSVSAWIYRTATRLSIDQLRQGLSYAFSEIQHGRIAPPGTNVLGFTGFGITNSGLNIEVSVPGRFAWRLGRDTAVEWVPWFGLPWYAAPNAAGDLRFLVGVGAGLDVWARVHGSTRLGVSLGLTTFDDSDADRALRAWGAIGAAWRLGDRWSLNLGLGYAQNLLAGDPSIGESGAIEDGGQVRVGSVLTNGILPLPLVGYQVSEALSLGLSAQVGYRIPDGAIDLELTLGWTWRFETAEVFFQ